MNPRSLVLHALLECTPTLRVHSLRRFKQGWDNHVYELNHSLIVKLSKNASGGGKLLKEACLLPYLREGLGEIIPRRLASRVVVVGGEHRVILVYEAIPGKTIVRRVPSQTLSTHIQCRRLAQILRSVHTLSPPAECAGLVPVYDTPQKWGENILSEVHRLTEMAGSTLQPDLRKTIFGYVDHYVGRLQRYGFTPRLIHGDIDPRNILIDASGHIVGLIDWGEAAVGDPALDYAGLFYVDEHVGRHVLKIQCEEQVRTLLPRLRFHRDLAPLYWVAYGASNNDHSLVDKGLKILQARFHP